MPNFFIKHSTAILMSLLVTMLVLAWLFPSAGLKVGIAFLLLSFFIASLVVLEKHRQAYRKGEIPRPIFIRNAAIEVLGTGLVMGLAGPLGRLAARTTVPPFDPPLLRVGAGITVGLVVGLSVGILAKKTIRRLVEVSLKAQG